MQARLKQARKALGLNQSEFAEKLGLTQQAYCMLENGKNPITERHIKPICAIYNISEEWLKTGTGDMFQSSQRLAHFEEVISQLNDEQLEYLIDFANMLAKRQDAMLSQQDGEEG